MLKKEIRRHVAVIILLNAIVCQNFLKQEATALNQLDAGVNIATTFSLGWNLGWIHYGPSYYEKTLAVQNCIQAHENVHLWVGTISFSQRDAAVKELEAYSVSFLKIRKLKRTLKNNKELDIIELEWAMNIMHLMNFLSEQHG